MGEKEATKKDAKDTERKSQKNKKELTSRGREMKNKKSGI